MGGAILKRSLSLFGAGASEVPVDPPHELVVRLPVRVDVLFRDSGSAGRKKRRRRRGRRKRAAVVGLGGIRMRRGNVVGVLENFHIGIAAAARTLC